ncbi:RNA-binding protein 25-like [Rhipicephalus sanguineus]|uniref:RNA-binding protein 25-like n=1 Tax=Rhipicephalus sanguineus TaxID=34632 RepID=UPI001894DE08|nr:RNA-binding protein 25-like [Rhipicephalus sanguineus]
MRKKSYRDSERQHRRSGKAQGGHARRPRPKNNRGKNHAPRSSKNETSLAESDRGSDQARRTRHDSTSNSSSSQSPERTRPREKRRPKKEPSSESNSDSFESERTSDSERPKRQQYTVVKQSETEENEEYDRKLREWRLREKMSAYEARLKVWVSRERFMAKERKRKRRIEQLKQIEAAKTTRLLNAFMEHYNDRRDDAKYYSGGALWIRVRFREREIAFDIKDRARERKELEKARLKRAAKNTSCGVAEKKCTGFIELPGELERQDPVKPLSDSSRQVTSMLEENDCIEIPLPTATLQPDQSRAKDCVDSAELPGKLD